MAQARVAAAPHDDKAPSDGALVSSDVEVQQDCNDNVALPSREVQVDQCGNDIGALAPSDDALAPSDIQVHQHGHNDGAPVASDDALLSSHNAAVASLDVQVGQGCNDDGDLALPGDAFDENTLVSFDLCVHQGGNDDGALTSSDDVVLREVADEEPKGPICRESSHNGHELLFLTEGSCKDSFIHNFCP